MALALIYMPENELWTSKASSLSEDCPRTYKETTTVTSTNVAL